MPDCGTLVGMIDIPASGRPIRRRWWVASTVVIALLLTGGLLLLRPSAVSAPVSKLENAWPAGPVRPAGRAWPADPNPAGGTAPPAAVAPPSGSSAVPSASRTVLSASSVPAAADQPALPGRVPTRGTGKFVYAAGRGKVLGTGGPLRRFRVAVEQGSEEDVAAFAAQVEATLGDTRSWIGGGRLRLQRVGGADAYDFTVYLATRDTAGVMCARGGVNVRVGGRPYTSCRSTGKAIINLDRWRLSARPYVAAGVPLTVYRQYVINHEVGHELGRSHQGCPKSGGPAPVMVQQTLTVRGCTPYAWPRRGNRELVGPYL